jgi:Mg/Co/Ni transporter MgtE
MMISNATELALSFARTLPREASRVLDPLDESDVAAFIVTVPADVAGAVLRNMLRWRAAACLECLPLDKTATILESMDFYDAVDILRQIPSSERSSILTELPRGLTRSIKTALRYPDGTVGALMNPALPMFPHDATVKEAISQVRNWRTNIGHVFLYRDEKRFHAAVPVSALVKVRSGTSLMSIAENDVAPVFSHADVRSVSQEADWDNYPVRRGAASPATSLRMAFENWANNIGRQCVHRLRPKLQHASRSDGRIAWQRISGRRDGKKT